MNKMQHIVEIWCTQNGAGNYCSGIWKLIYNVQLFLCSQQSMVLLHFPPKIWVKKYYSKLLHWRGKVWEGHIYCTMSWEESQKEALPWGCGGRAKLHEETPTGNLPLIVEAPFDFKKSSHVRVHLLLSVIVVSCLMAGLLLEHSS